MKKKIKILLLLISCAGPLILYSQPFYQTSDARISFFSSAPIEDITAVSKKGISVINFQTGEISFQVKIRSFQFEKGKMQEHFNENFMESHKFPSARFKGNIDEVIDPSKNGENKIILRGILKVHGVSRNMEIPAILKIENGEIFLRSKFKVACKDHDIEIPKILWENIAEIVEVSVNANYTKLK